MSAVPAVRPAILRAFLLPISRPTTPPARAPVGEFPHARAAVGHSARRSGRSLPLTLPLMMALLTELTHDLREIAGLGGVDDLVQKTARVEHGVFPYVMNRWQTDTWEPDAVLQAVPASDEARSGGDGTGYVILPDEPRAIAPRDTPALQG